MITYRLRSMKADIKKSEEEGKKKTELRQEREAENKKKTRKLGKMKYPCIIKWL